MRAPLLPRLPPRRPPPPREALASALLLLALASVFVFGHDRSQSYRANTHGTTLPTLTLAANLSAEHRFLLFEQQKRGPGGETQFVTYARFPIGSYALVGLAILPFGDDFPRAFRAARLAMLACFAAAAALAWLALARLIGDRRIALAATLLAFSSYYLLYYNDMVSAETSTNVLGVMLVFHGMAVFAQEGRFRQLLAKTAVAIFLGWHVAGLIAPFVLIGLGGELLRARRGGSGVRAALAAAARSRHVVYGAISVLLCALALGFNLGNEYLALGGGTPPHELPTFHSLLGRSGADAAHGDVSGMDWWTFLRGGLGGVGGMAIPFAAADLLGLDLAQRQVWPPDPWLAVPGAAALAACAAGLRFLPQRALFAALLAAGWVWALMFRGNIWHEWETMFHLGVPLVFWTLALLGLRRLSGRNEGRALPAAALAAAAVFVLSAAAMGRLGHGAEAAAFQSEATADFRAMRPFATGRTVLFDPVTRAGAPTLKHVRYWLHGSYLEPDEVGSEREWAAASRYDFVVLPVDLGGSLTPHNRRFHLYRPAALDAAWDALAAREPAARSEFEVRLDGRAIAWTRDECAEEDVWPPLFVHAVPLDANDLAPDRRAAGFEAAAYFLPNHGARFGGRCAARAALPDYPLAGLRTGQRAEGLPALWEASLPVEDASFPRGVSGWRGTAEAARPALSSAFAVSIEGRTLHYLREGCAEADTAARFFVHAVAADARDLPEARRPYGSERLTFSFAERGMRYGGACLAAFELPDYAILGVRTGQYGDAGEVWSGAFPLDPEAWRARYEAAAALEPSLRSAFDVRAEGRTLHYTREQCAEADTAARFFLHVTPLDANDLPEERREAGFANLDFAFGDRGLRHEGRCLASVPLPGYPIARLATGQFEGDTRLWEGEVAFPAASE